MPPAPRCVGLVYSAKFQGHVAHPILGLTYDCHKQFFPLTKVCPIVIHSDAFYSFISPLQKSK